MLTVVLALTASVWAADPFIGTWKLNATASKFVPGPPLRGLTMTWSPEASGVRVRSEGIRADGSRLQEGYVAIYDGVERKKPGPWIATS